MSLTGKQRRKLRALGHHLAPIVIVGQNGVTPGVVAATDQALFDHELVKVKLPEGREDRLDTVRRLAEETESEVAQVLGRTALLYRRRLEDSKIEV
jgi:RNA-binding protein